MTELTIDERLRRLSRTAEMSAGIVRDPERTGGWPGAEKTAMAFDRIKDTIDEIRAALPPVAPACDPTEIAGDAVHYSEEHDNYYCSKCKSGLGHKVYRALRAIDAPSAPDTRPGPPVAPAGDREAVAWEIVKRLFVDLRDRKLLKWFFPPADEYDPDFFIGDITVKPITPEVQEEIAAAWRQIALAALSRARTGSEAQ